MHNRFCSRQFTLFYLEELKMEKQYRFRAQQGRDQVSRICKLMTHVLEVKPRCKKEDDYVLITATLPIGMSKRSVDKFLYAHEVPGSVSRKNKYPVLKGDKWDVMYHDKAEDWFSWVCDGKFKGVYKTTYYDYGCECCGGYTTLISKNGDYVI